MRTTGLTSIALGAVLATILTACTATDGTGGTAGTGGASGAAGTGGGIPAGMELPAKNIDTWAMPLDEFTPPSANPLASYAENLLVAECLGESGIRWPIPWQSTDDAAYPRIDWTRPGVSVESAREGGYRRGASGPSSRTAEEEQAIIMELNAIAVSTPGFDPLFTACLNEAREVVPSLRMMTDSNLLLGWVGDSFANVKGVPAVIDATASWRECMTKAGYAETPNSPFEMVTSLDNFGIPPMYESGADGAPLSPLTQAEIMLAVADATCQESSGWTQAIYDTQWDAQVKVLSEHADELVRMRDQWDKDREVLLRIIAENAPAK